MANESKGKRAKTCPHCQATFHCGSAEAEGRCWCAALPRIMPIDVDDECWCPDCLRLELDDRVSLYKMNGAAAENTSATEEA